MQIVLKVNHNSSRPKIPYIVDTGYKKRGCYTRNLNYYKFEEQIIEVIKKICKIYTNKSILEETYKKVTNKTRDLVSSLKKQIETIEIKIIENNNIIDKLYEDKLKRDINRSGFHTNLSKMYKGKRKVKREKV